uniref:RING-type domain-containing protein n=1 Tax=Monopterus albus TaxID=43700 RepID=A0A3Q3Q572_MONAL|nr:RING finger protein 225-like [Monopterus albus]
MSGERERPRPEGSQSRGAIQAPNVKPKLSQKETNCKADYWNKEKPVKVRRSRSTDSEKVERGRRRERDQYSREKRQRGRSEEARRRHKREGECHWKNTNAPEDDVEETECAVCFCSYDNVFKTPKLLACGHTFCLECLARINVSSPELKTLSCPVCRDLTELPHGQDLPRLGNNEDIIGKLPKDMQRALSIRFHRSKGKLLLKNPPPGSQTKLKALTLPKKSHGSQVPASGDLHSGAVEQEIATTTVINVGRPPSRMRGRLRSLFRSDRCYYAVVASIISITVVLLLVVILAFVIMPSVMIYKKPVNQMPHSPSGSEDSGGH